MLRSVGFEPYQTISDGVRAIVHCQRVKSPALVTEEWANTTEAGNPQVPLAAPSVAAIEPRTRRAIRSLALQLNHRCNC